MAEHSDKKEGAQFFPLKVKSKKQATKNVAKG